MKKLVAFIFAFILFMSLSCKGNTAYSIKCKKCIEERKRNKQVYIEIGIANRDFGTPIIHKNGKAYATYKCHYGHSFLVDLSE